MKKRLLFLSPFFYPEQISTGKYNTLLVKALRNKGMSIDVIASYPLYPNWKPEKSNIEMENVSICRGGFSIRYPKALILRRLVLEIWYAYHVIIHARPRNKKYDIVIAVFPPSLFFYFANIIFPNNKSMKKIGIIHDLQDVYTAKQNSYLRSIISLGINFIEKRTFLYCDKLIFLSHAMARKATENYELEKHKVFVQYPFVTVTDNITSTNLMQIFPAQYRHVVYSGAIGAKQNPKELLKFFKCASKRIANAHFHIFSRGQLFEELRKERNDNSKIFFHDLVADEDLEELYLRSDVQIVPQDEGTSEGSLPSKLPNILAMGTYVFIITDKISELSDIITNEDIGIIVDAWDIETLVQKLKDVLDNNNLMNRDKRKHLVFGMLKEKFNIDTLVEAILN